MNCSLSEFRHWIQKRRPGIALVESLSVNDYEVRELMVLVDGVPLATLEYARMCECASFCV